MAHALAVEKGWYQDGGRNIPEALCLIHSEISEALEEYRSGECTLTGYQLRIGGKPEGFAVEIADAVIRIADLCGHLGIDLADHVRRKHAFNTTRPERHGGKRC